MRDRWLRGQEAHMSHHIRPFVVVAGLLFAACGSSDSGQPAESSVTEQVGTADTVASAKAVAETPAEDTAEETAASNIPPEPVNLREFMLLTSDWSYTSTRFDIPFTFSVPGDTDGRFEAVFDNQWSTALSLYVSPRSPDVAGDLQPRVQLSTVADGVSQDDIVASVMAYAEEHDEFEVTMEPGLLRGEAVTVLRGTSTFDSAEPGSSADTLIPTSEDTYIKMELGDREFIIFVGEVDSQPMVYVFDSDPSQFDLTVKNGSALLETVQFL